MKIVEKRQITKELKPPLENKMLLFVPYISANKLFVLYAFKDIIGKDSKAEWMWESEREKIVGKNLKRNY